MDDVEKMLPSEFDQRALNGMVHASLTEAHAVLQAHEAAITMLRAQVEGQGKQIAALRAELDRRTGEL